MSLPAAPPRFASWSDLVAPIANGETGWRVFALQSALNSVRWVDVDTGHAPAYARVEPDGSFGPATLTEVKGGQKRLKLTADGVAGAATQKAILDYLGDRTHDLLPDLPVGLMRGFSESEGANMLAATNWSVPGGVDCGCVQLRVYGPPYSLDELRGAFDPMDSLMSAATTFLARAKVFNEGVWIRQQGARRRELALRTAVMAHNWPAGAESIAKYGSCSWPSDRADWVPAGVKFPDGAAVVTRGDWCAFYAMGGPHGKGSVTKYVSDWS